MLKSQELNLKGTNVQAYNRAKKYLMKMRSFSHTYSLIHRLGTHYYNGPFACYLVYVCGLDFKVTFFPYLPILVSKYYS